ncbi:MAG: hypothetical protein WC538_09830 [Thermoanaerobaculia bacterium]|jgi:hypothetical protein
MPQAHGSDRLETLGGGRFRIVSSSPKGWRPARSATRTTAEFPGTAVAWDGSLWEVLSCEEREGASSRYVLAPWREHHAIRLTVDYDEASEAALETARRKAATRRRASTGLVAAGLATGHLPAHVQQEIESEYGFFATRLTLTSVATQVVFGAIAFAGLPIEGLPGPKWPLSIVALGVVVFFESLVRGWYSLLRNQPIGSIEGLLAWSVLCAFSQRARRFDRAARRQSERQRSTTSVLPPEEFIRERDAYAVREPFLALLPRESQEQLANSFGFDPHEWGIKSAATIAALSGAGIVSALLKIADKVSTFDTWLSLTLATLLFVEQMKRLLDVRRGSASGSVLGAFVRPFCTKLLSVPPRALEKGSTNRLERSLPEVWDGDASGSGDDQTGR